VSFTIRFLVASTAFWLLDQSGVKVMSGAFAIFFSGMMLPLVLFPGWLGTLAEALPWAAYLQVPADIWLGKHTGAGLLAALGFQVLWAVVLLAACHGVLRLATRKVVVQGG
jgi:ABC-2 type transport system permease protein